MRKWMFSPSKVFALASYLDLVVIYFFLVVFMPNLKTGIYCRAIYCPILCGPIQYFMVSYAAFMHSETRLDHRFHAIFCIHGSCFPRYQGLTYIHLHPSPHPKKKSVFQFQEIFLGALENFCTLAKPYINKYYHNTILINVWYTVYVVT